MQTYLIVVGVADYVRYVKYHGEDEQGMMFELVSKIDASLFSGEQIEQYVPMIKTQHDKAYAHYGNKLNIYAEPFKEVTLR